MGDLFGPPTYYSYIAIDIWNNKGSDSSSAISEQCFLLFQRVRGATLLRLKPLVLRYEYLQAIVYPSDNHRSKTMANKICHPLKALQW